MKIALTHGYFLSEDPKEQEIMRPYPTLGLLYISSWLKQHDFNTSIVDSTFMQPEEWKEHMRNLQPDVVACYANLMTRVQVIRLVEWLQAELPDCVLIVGGPDVTYNKDNYLRAGFQYVISGEGEVTMQELCAALRDGTSVAHIEGITRLVDGVPEQHPERSKLRELSVLPFPDRAAIPIEKYLDTWQQFHGKRTLNISTQRGCPYTCKWCSTAVYGQSYRRNDPKRVVEEILHLKRDFGVEALWFVDDVFTVSHKWISDLHREFQEHKLEIPFECITRAERLTETVLRQLKEMGCFRIWIGAESGSQQVIDRMDRRVELSTVQRMMQLTRSLGMEAGTFIMVGYPGEKLDDIRQTLKHIQACNPHLLTITRAYPIKGTGLYEEIEEQITYLPEWKSGSDRDIRFALPYSDRFYRFAIRYLVNGWMAHRDRSLKQRLKSKVAYSLMRIFR